MKRLVDVFLSISILILFSPIFLIVAGGVRLQLGSPVIFKQQRPGLHHKPFQLYKLRTMINEKEKNGVLLTDEERLTALGKWIRKYSLDELPQFINVLKGEMSIVGPRPLLMEYLPLYNEEQLLRHTVKPGITGWAQVNGRNAITWEEKFKLDIWYAKNQNLLLDSRILVLTFIKVLKREGITQQGSATMTKFHGTKEAQ